MTFYMATAPTTPAVPSKTKVYLLNGYEHDEMAVQVSWTAPMDKGAYITWYRLYMSENVENYKLIYDG
jgi:hypothetical protein